MFDLLPEFLLIPLVVGTVVSLLAFTYQSRRHLVSRRCYDHVEPVPGFSGAPLRLVEREGGTADTDPAPHLTGMRVSGRGLPSATDYRQGRRMSRRKSGSPWRILRPSARSSPRCATFARPAARSSRRSASQGGTGQCGGSPCGPKSSQVEATD